MINLSIIAVAPGIDGPFGEKVFLAVITSLSVSFLFYLMGRKGKASTTIDDEFGIDDYYVLKIIANDSRAKLEFDYEGTFKELKEKCNPKLYLEPHQPQKLDIAANLFARINEIENNWNKLEIRKIRKKADEELGIKLSSEKSYRILIEIYDPKKYVDGQFDKDKLLACNRAYKYISENKNDIRKLEQFAKKVGILEY
ncbi:MAG: hypothetical protein K2M19_04975 [Muribaculaceae bacterium]|nr:hypothetical protein [Muribaculaceae bacterium]